MNASKVKYYRCRLEDIWEQKEPPVITWSPLSPEEKRQDRCSQWQLVNSSVWSFDRGSYNRHSSVAYRYCRWGDEGLQFISYLSRVLSPTGRFMVKPKSTSWCTLKATWHISRLHLPMFYQKAHFMFWHIVIMLAIRIFDTGDPAWGMMSIPL